VPERQPPASPLRAVIGKLRASGLTAVQWEHGKVVRDGFYARKDPRQEGVWVSYHGGLRSHRETQRHRIARSLEASGFAVRKVDSELYVTRGREQS
jgi:hypothetical protein